jgi:methyl-accepting chemotaxis protein
MSRLSISLRLGLLIALTAIGILTASVSGLLLLRQQMVDDRLTQIGNLLDSAIAVGRAEMKLAGSDPAAQRKALVDVLKSARFGTAKEVNYIFAYGFDGLYLAHINPAKIGTNGLHQANPVDSETVASLMKIGLSAEGRGYHWYATPKVPNGPYLPKVSIVQKIPEAEVVAGLGVYIDDIDAIFWTRCEFMGLIFAGVMGVTLIIGYFIRRSICRPLNDLTQRMAALANGDTSQPIEGIDDKTELGAFARSLELFRQSSIENHAKIGREQAEDTQRAARARRIEQLNAAFDSSVTRQLAKIEQTASAFQAASQQLSTTAQDTNSRIGTVAAASEQSSANVRSAAAATEELTASVNEIGGQVRHSSAIANRAVAEARATNEQIAGLVQATSRIGEVVNLITSIASQTNLLALNATIEAARAGEAGRGFAIVASEVKNLATQTGKATEEIAGQISAIQHETNQAVEAIKAIAATIESIDQIAAGVANSVEEQKLATNEIAVNTSVAAAGTSDVTNTIGMVADAARQTEATARSLSDAASGLQSEAEALRMAVQSFLADVKAA